ncbi:helix-turn-helix domain-containing protein [Flagellimonas meishanensis]|uniref:helix-turn-helix domain-containing protein n=1 Tax=Flagellimonas meishanensis TaxID=2873264 RepID=UPI001CA62A21|nr:helix-turn-helix domain-containing protein [[Muricauda] meishanensis]
MEHITLDIWSALLVFGLLQGLFLSIVLITGFTNKKPKYFLISLIVIVSLNLFNYLIIISELYAKVPHLSYLSLPLLFLIGPFFLYYIRSIIDPRLRLKLSDLLHALLFLLAVVFMLPFFMLPGDIKIELLRAQIHPEGQTFDLGTQILTLAQIVQSFIYVAVSLRILSRKIAGNVDRAQENKLRWMKKFAIGFLAFWLVDFLAALWYLQKGFIDIRVYYLTMFCCALAINFLVILAITNNRTFKEVFLGMTRMRYKSSNLLQSDLKRHLSEIIAHMEDEKPYLDHELSLSKLSKDLDKPKYLISQVLNVELGKSFYEFLSEYRYEEVKSRLTNPQYRNLTILAIAYDSGFSNKNTFNKVFKKLSGTTPTEFLKSTSKSA